MMERLKYLFSDILVITKKNLIRYKRVPRLLIFSSIQPVMFLLLFNYVFGGALRLPPGVDNYINYLMPGILVQTVLFGATQATVGLAEDMSKGLIDRFRSLPMARSAVIAGRTIADSVRNVLVVLLLIGVGYLLGFRFQNGFGSAAIAFLIMILFGFVFSWISVYIGLIAKDPESAQAAGFIWVFPLVFASSVFVPVQTMPGWLQGFAEHQPISVTVNAVRSFTLGGSHGDLWWALLWMAGILLVFVPLSVRQYRKSNK